MAWLPGTVGGVPPPGIANANRSLHSTQRKRNWLAFLGRVFLALGLVVSLTGGGGALLLLVLVLLLWGAPWPSSCGPSYLTLRL